MPHWFGFGPFSYQDVSDKVFAHYGLIPQALPDDAALVDSPSLA